MPVPELGGEAVDDILQGLHLLRRGDVAVPEGLGGPGDGLRQGVGDDLEVRLGGGGKAVAALGHVPGVLGNVHGVVADAL